MNLCFAIMIWSNMVTVYMITRYISSVKSCFQQPQWMQTCTYYVPETSTLIHYNSIRLGSWQSLSWAAPGGAINVSQRLADSQTEISRTTQPAEIEVSHVNWILREQSRSIPRRPAEKPPATIRLEYYSRHHRNIQQTRYRVPLMHTGTLWTVCWYNM